MNTDMSETDYEVGYSDGRAGLTIYSGIRTLTHTADNPVDMTGYENGFNQGRIDRGMEMNYYPEEGS